jgi:2'-5' RNA ligase
MPVLNTQVPMSEQLWLPGLEAPPALTDGLFFAVIPDTQTATGIAKLARQLCDDAHSRSKPLAANRLHVTLHHLGNFSGGLPQAQIDAAMKAAAVVSMHPFSIDFDSATRFAKKPRPGPLVLCGSEGIVGLHALHDALGSALDQAGFEGREAAPFTPHVTLAYGLPWSEPRAIEAVSWNVREFVLLHSLLGRTRHLPLGRWALTGAA